MEPSAAFASIDTEPDPVGRWDQRFMATVVTDWWTRNVSNITVALILALLVGGWQMQRAQVEMVGHMHLLEYRVSQLERFACPPVEILPP